LFFQRGIHGRPARATILIVQTTDHHQQQQQQQQLAYSDTRSDSPASNINSNSSSSSSSSALFGCAVLDASWGEVEQASKLYSGGGPFEGGSDSFLFSLLPPPPLPVHLDESQPQQHQQHQQKEQQQLNRRRRRVFSRNPTAVSAAGAGGAALLLPVLSVTSDFLGVGPALDGDGFALMVGADLHTGSSVATEVFANPPLHRLADEEEEKEVGGGEHRVSPLSDTRDFQISTIELYALV
jgi:hypothetical protein